MDDYAEFRSFVQTDELDNEIKKAGGTTHGLNKYIKQSLENWKSRKMNVAITGNSGTGKSSLINAIRNMKPSDDGAANVGVVETTIKALKYTYPANKAVALCDLPGIGKFTKEEYLKYANFSRFDVVIIVTCTRFSENDICLAKSVSALRKHVLFVRTKIDEDMVNAKRDYPDEFEEEKCMSKMREDLKKNVRKLGLEQAKLDLYLVSSAERNSYDFNKLDDKLKGLLNNKVKAISEMLKKHVEAKIEAKHNSIKKEFKLNKIASVVYGFLPVPNLETGLGRFNVSLVREGCLRRFCLDDESLDRISNELGEPKGSLLKYLEAHKISESLVDSTEEKEFSTFRQYSKYLLPVLGSFLSIHKNWSTLQGCLEEICNAAAKDERILVGMILIKLEKELDLRLI